MALISSTNLNIGPGNINLIGNPYPSALDATTFITDNASILTEHCISGKHSHNK